MAADADTLQRVVDELDIRNLLARIHNTIDAMRRGEATAEDYNANWTEDGIWESPTMGTYHGHEGHQKRRDEAGALARQGGAQIPDAGSQSSGTYHITVSTEVRLDGDVAICDSKFLYGTSQGTGGQIHQVGRYHDEVRRTPEGWKLSHRTVFP
jgi:ketosteroid isomerase-like protein